MPTTDLPLRDIHVPEAIGWWPPAIGWWLILILIPVLLAVMWWLYRRLTRQTAISVAKKKLAEIRRDQGLDDLQKLRAISILIRRTAISVAPRSQAAGLTGNAWLAYLDRSLPEAPFSEGIGRYLNDFSYCLQAPPELETDKLFELCENWLNAQTMK